MSVENVGMGENRMAVRKRTRIAVELVCLLIVALLIWRPRLPERIALNASSDKNDYLIGEPIMVDIVLRNRGLWRIRVPQLEMGNEVVKFTIRDPNNEVLSFTGWTHEVLPTVVLPARKSHAKSFNVADYHNVATPGTYSIQAVYESDGSGWPDTEEIRSCWQGVLESDTITVRVTAPVGVDAEALGLLRSGRSSRGREQLQYLCSRDLRTAQEMVTRYPSSAYAKYGQYYIARHMGGDFFASRRGWTKQDVDRYISEVKTGDPLKAVGAFKKVVDNYAKFSLTDEALLSMGVLYQKLGHVDKAKVVLDRLSQECPGSIYVSQISGVLRN